ncbi:MAG: class I SAM-dependent methyltransferase [Candidatus Aenigmarchaeota archaeon]|nr:class I SAM-dependent methyltransferase [Candidatus Aenigmarchaeota archaeon]
MNELPISLYVEPDRFRELEKRFLIYAKGHVLDIGHGPGRVGLYLGEKGYKITGVDNSDDMVYIAKKRGLTSLKMDINEELPEDIFDTVIMYGNGLGLPGSIENIKSLLKRLQPITSEHALIVAESNNPSLMENQIDLDYQKLNQESNRYIGYRNWRHVSGELIGEYHPWIQMEPKLLGEIAEETGWEITAGPIYEKESEWGAYFFCLEKHKSSQIPEPLTL